MQNHKYLLFFEYLTGPIVVLALSLFAGHHAFLYGIWENGGPSSGLLPLICSLCLLILGLVDLLLRFKTYKFRRLVNVEAENKDLSENANKKSVLIYISTLICCSIALYWMGFLISVFLGLLVVMRYAEDLTWFKAISNSFAIILFCWVLFSIFLSVNLPASRIFIY